MQQCSTDDNPIACSYFTIHNLILEKLNALNASSIKLNNEDELIISTILKFDKEGNNVRKSSVLHSEYVNASLEFEELLKSMPNIERELNDKGDPKTAYFRNTFYYKYANAKFETWNNTNAKKEDFNMPEKVPVYNGCKPKWSNKKLRDCMSIKVAQYIQSAFNTKIAQNSGIQRGTEVVIYTSFKVDETGKVVDVAARGPNSALENEAIRLLKRLSKIEPGYQGNKPVVVPYSLPIRFRISY